MDNDVIILEGDQCKECRYYVRDIYAPFNSGIPLIVDHDICKKEGHGHKTKPSHWCPMFEEKGGD